jgi:cytochrome c oxidase cbb3-type subunit 3
MKILRFSFLAIVLGATLLAQAPRANPDAGAARDGRARVDTAGIERGKDVYSRNCGFCHGVNARGGSEAPDLVRSLNVLGDENGKELGEFLKVGSPSKGMPSFANLPKEQVADLAAFLHDRVAAARRRTPTNVNAVLIGDANAGRAYFNGAGRCNSCHSESGDLKGVGTKFDPMTLQDHIVDPRLRARGDTRPLKPITVEVTLPSGESVSGSLVSISDFSVTLQQPGGDRRTFARDENSPKVKTFDPAQAHLDMLMKYTDKSLHDLTAYLVTLK